MTWIMLSLWTCFRLAAAPSTPAAKDLPPDWPPLPDFKHPVDYAKWLQDCLSAPPEDDARPLWNAITGQNGDSEQVKQAKHRLWGEDDRGGMSGLFTGNEETPDRYAWDPDKHPRWGRRYANSQPAIENGDYVFWPIQPRR